jgi:hypothetical protein
MQSSQIGYQSPANAYPNAPQGTIEGDRSFPHALDRLESIVKRIQEAEQHLRFTHNLIEAQPEPLTVNKDAPQPSTPTTVLGRLYVAINAVDLALEGINVHRHDISKLVSGS